MKTSAFEKLFVKAMFYLTKPTIIVTVKLQIISRARPFKWQDTLKRRGYFMLTLYHADTAVCAAKVRVVLAEKAIPYESRLMALSRGDQFTPEYLTLNANAVVPTIIRVATADTVGSRRDSM